MPAHPKSPVKYVIEDRGYTSPCWVWQRGGNRGYGTVSIGGKARYAHRVAYEERYGPIPDGLHIDHLCEVRGCVNPEHLEPVTQAENNRRARASKLRRTADRAGVAA